MGTLLAPSKELTSSLLAGSEFLLLLGAVLVVVGLFGEGKLPSWSHKLKRFERMVLLGCAIELIADGGVFVFSRRLETLADLEIAELRKDAISLGERSTANEKEAARLNKLAEDEKSERVKIEARVAWRRLSSEQKVAFGANISRRFSNQGVSLWFNAGDTEARSFAMDIADALRLGRTLRVYDPAGALILPEAGRINERLSLRTGVRIQTTRDDRSRQLADALVSELSRLGFDAARQTDPPFDPNPVPQVWVNVDSRPNGPQGEFKLAAQRSKADKK